MLSKYKNICSVLVIAIFLSACSGKRKILLSNETLENCKKWNWIALADSDVWTPKGEAYFTYAGSFYCPRRLTKEELTLCGVWEPVYTSVYFASSVEKYESQYRKSGINGRIGFRRDGTGFAASNVFSSKCNNRFRYIFSFNWKILKNILFITPVKIEEIEELENKVNLTNTYFFSDSSCYKIGKIDFDKQYLIQLSNWDFSAIPVKQTFIYQKYGINTLGTDCLRYKYTWIEDWNVPVLQKYIEYNQEYTLEELQNMDFYQMEHKD